MPERAPISFEAYRRTHRLIPVDTPIDDLQDRVDAFEVDRIPPVERTINRGINRASSEFQELLDAGNKIRDRGGVIFDIKERDHVAEEATDVIIAMMGIVAVTGHRVTELIEEKLQIMDEKYPADKLRELRAQGMTHENAMSRLKQEWTIRTKGYQEEPY